MSFGGYDVLKARNIKPVPSYFFAEHGFRSFGASVSTLDYSWSDKAGKRILTGHYDVSQSPYTIGKGQGFSIFVPIMIPEKSGSFTPFTHFDSKHLSNQLHSMSRSDGADYLGCFEATAEASVVLPSD